MPSKGLNANAKKWVKALKSGKYTQVTGTLTKSLDLEKGEKGFCCLGVACDIQTVVPFNEWRYFGSLTGNVSPVANMLDLTTDDGQFKKGAYAEFPNADCLVDLNDAYHVPFEKIGEFIASNPPGLFTPRPKGF